MTDYMYNIDDEVVEVVETETGTLVRYPDGCEKIFDTYSDAINFLYRRGWIF